MYYLHDTPLRMPHTLPFNSMAETLNLSTTASAPSKEDITTSGQVSVSTPTADAAASLMNIPPELRQRIYEHLFRGTIVDIDFHNGTTEAPPIPLCCKQIYAEAASIYYNRCEFVVARDRDSEDISWRWLYGLPATRRAQLTEVHIKYHTESLLNSVGWGLALAEAEYQESFLRDTNDFFRQEGIVVPAGTLKVILNYDHERAEATTTPYEDVRKDRLDVFAERIQSSKAYKRALEATINEGEPIALAEITEDIEWREDVLEIIREREYTRFATKRSIWC